jgi:hypothetical protein
VSKAGCLANAWLRRLAFAASVPVLVCGSNVPLAHACKQVAPTPHTLDPAAQATDSTAPGIPTVTVTFVRRGKGPETNYSSCSQSASSCDDLGSIALQLSAQDDQTPTDKLGYQIELAAGQLPSGMTLPPTPVRTMGGTIPLSWNDGASDDQESISFSLEVRAVDLAGNFGPATTVEVHDGGSGGCSVGPRPLSAWSTTTLAIWLFARLLRGRRRAGRKAPEGA